jgi:hypothetical protein
MVVHYERMGKCQLTCKQKVQTTKHQSISVLGTSVILIVGVIIMLISTCLEPLLDAMVKIPWLRNSERFCYAHAEWQAGSTLQLQRLAHESLGMGSWSKTGESVPVTEPGDVLGVFDIRNPEHVRLIRPETELCKLSKDDKTNLTKRRQYVRIPSIERHT